MFHCSPNLYSIHCRDQLVLGPTFSGLDRNPPSSQPRNQVPARPRVICAQQPCTGRTPSPYYMPPSEALHSFPSPLRLFPFLQHGRPLHLMFPCLKSDNVFVYFVSPLLPQNHKLLESKAGLCFVSCHMLRPVPGMWQTISPSLLRE